ncbi:hypothetical protein DFR29_101153 [Tahibacter aquaticus]|uniref:Big-1 domain-containing protein n=1 Tax=Tahibacter aquaticus TaxID=520092 RepID=A0A4R6Z9F5_9GAMM|nr:Ig-like domain-containing protein [Tahibacter aquaticus]TDR48533.1 hypothetical protein DFR29_101153 [Tahibacter aquaticus]
MSISLDSVAQSQVLLKLRRAACMRQLSALVLVLGCTATLPAAAGLLNVPNGDFSAPSDAGTVGGGVLGSSGTNVLIGAGPWMASYRGVIGLLAPPLMQIDSVTRSASISDVLGIQALSILNNGGYFSQIVPASYQPNKRYTLVTEIRQGVDLDLPVMAVSGVGSAFRAGNTVLGRSGTAAADHVRADKIDATTQRLAYSYDTGPAASGPIGIEMYDEPQGLLHAQLQESAEFSRVKLAESTIPPANSTLTVSGGGSQSALIGTPYGAPMIATVRDGNGNPLSDVLVTLAAPADFASAVISTDSETGTVIAGFTDANGQVRLTAVANPVAGCFKITASVLGINGTGAFNLRNYTQQQALAYKRANPDVIDAFQDSVYCNGFE